MISSSSSGLNSLQQAILPQFFNFFDLATISTRKDAKEANGSASKNSKLLIAVLLYCVLKAFLLSSPTQTASYYNEGGTCLRCSPPVLNQAQSSRAFSTFTFAAQILGMWFL
ncbi:hypothetical protein V6N13_122594 [Hibiscus sabdariffa]